jgi:putative ABC transport system ATP-binding protein/lipoprotein-releasing system ATP-binding protein
MSILGKNLIKEFGAPPTRALNGVNLEINEGEFVSITGRSGSGKSTLLYILSTLDNPTQGILEIDGNIPKKMNQRDLHHFRNNRIGFIFQFHYLLPELTSLENILLGPRNLGMHKQYTKRARDLLEELGIVDEIHKYPGQMSGGQQQRVAIARALILNPKYIFADEPTGNLDTHNANMVMKILKQTNKDHKTTIVLVTHEPDFSAMAHREILLVDGKVTA